MLRRVTTIVTGLLVVGAARASPYWVSWDDGWPEDQGWTHSVFGPPAVRWLEDGVLHIDTTAEFGSRDQYYQNPETLIPGPGESFVLQWRTRVDESIPAADPGLRVETEDNYTISLQMSTTKIESNYESGRFAEFAPGVFHDFELDSADMRGYSLYIDGQLAMQGVFSKSLFPGSVVAWGNFAGCKIIAEWDSVAYGIVPEPPSALCVVISVWLGRRSGR